MLRMKPRRRDTRTTPYPGDYRNPKGPRHGLCAIQYLNDSGAGRGQLLIVLCRFSVVVSGSYVPGGWRWRPVCPERAPAPTAPGWSPFRLRGRGGGQAGAGRAHRRCQQVVNASLQGQVRLIFSTRARAWRTRRAGRLSRR